MSAFAPQRPYALLLPGGLDLLLASQAGPTYLRLLCVARAGVMLTLTLSARWRKRGLYLVVPLASVMACVWETCKSTLYKYPDGGEGGGGEWDEWYGPEASASYLAETCVLALGEILLYTLLLRLTPRFAPRAPPAGKSWPLTPETPSPVNRFAWGPGRLAFGSLRASSAPTRPSPLGTAHSSCSSVSDGEGEAGYESDYPPTQGTSPSPGPSAGPPSAGPSSAGPSPGQLSVASGSGRGKERAHLLPSDAGDAEERGDLLAPLRVASYHDLPEHEAVEDGYDSSASESSIIDMPRRRMRPLDAESIGEVAEHASNSVISVVAGLGGIVRRSASRSLLGTSPGYGTFDA